MLEVGDSRVAPGTLGLYARLADGVTTVDLPAMTLIGGYSKGSFCRQVAQRRSLLPFLLTYGIVDPTLCKDSGDKTVGFALTSMNTAVFFNRELMTLGQALAAATVRLPSSERPARRAQ